MFFALRALHSPVPYKRTLFVVFMTATASLKSGTKLAPTLPLRRFCAAALNTKITHPAGAKQKILEPNCGVFI
ncbi:MAG: hypothetical protein MR878_01825 [Campylobacter sp.]|uniref:hypothetical protein n=1 Tax=Campylobacter sp. TaxID=205 RepID=UPI002AA8F95D|nr:hypothetical protein [Campylobacter sp.]MCI7014112.1 hypothetical protein [Campylobacter sp.]